MTPVTETIRFASPFAGIPSAPPDPIFGLTEAYQTDTNPNKVNLGVGVYQDGNGRVPILNVVREAEAQWLTREDSKSYLPIDGIHAYNKQVQALLFGADSPLLTDGRAVSLQALGGTGALKIGADFLKRYVGAERVWISDPSWENHRALFEAAGLEVRTYPYYLPQTHGLDFDAMHAALAALPPQSVVVLHACCHNPTGVDLTPAQWTTVADLCQERGLLPFLDFAYQGFGAGLDADAFAVRAFAAAGIPCLIANSFSKSFSLYRERIGGLTVLAADADEAKRVLSQLKRVVRTNYSNPSSYGGQLVAAILADATLRGQWEVELGAMRGRIAQMRTQLVEKLRASGVPQDFGFIAEQKGMFSYSGLPAEAVQRLRNEYSVYIVGSGRICVAALNEKNIDYVCNAIASVL